MDRRSSRTISFLGDEPAFAGLRRGRLSAGGLGGGNDFVEARVTAQRIPARIQEEIAVCRRISGKGRNFFQLLKRAVTLARSTRLFCRQFLKTPIVADSIPDRIESQRCGSKKRRSRV